METTGHNPRYDLEVYQTEPYFWGKQNRNAIQGQISFVVQLMKLLNKNANENRNKVRNAVVAVSASSQICRRYDFRIYYCFGEIYSGDCALNL